MFMALVICVVFLTASIFLLISLSVAIRSAFSRFPERRPLPLTVGVSLTTPCKFLVVGLERLGHQRVQVGVDNVSSP